MEYVSITLSISKFVGVHTWEGWRVESERWRGTWHGKATEYQNNFG